MRAEIAASVPPRDVEVPVGPVELRVRPVAQDPALARRLAGILYAMWRDNAPYNAAKLRVPRAPIARAG